MLAHLFLTSLALVFPQRSALEAQEPESLLATLPGDAVLVLAIEDFATLWEHAPHTAWGQLASDPVLAPMWNRVDGFVQAEIGDGLTLKTALDALEGGAFFVGPEGPDGEESMGLVLRLRPGFPELAYALRRRMERTGEPVEHEGRSMLLGRGGNAGSWEVFLAWSQGIAAVQTGGRESALQLASSLTRKLEAGTSDGVLSARLAGRRPAERTTLEAYLDVGALVATSLTPYGEQETNLYGALGLDDFGWGTLHGSLGEGTAFDVRATLDLSNAKLWPLLASHTRRVPTRLADLAPAETIEVTALGYDARQAWHSLKAWLALELPDAHEELVRYLATLSSSVGMDLERELFDQLSGEFATLLVPLPGDERPAFPGVTASLLLGLLGPPGSAATNVHLVGLEDAGVVERLVQKMVESSGESENVRVEEVAGHRLHFFEVPELNLSPSWAFVDGVLALSTHRSAVRAVLQQATPGPAPGWADRERIESLRADGTAFGASVADLQGLCRVELAAPLAMVLGFAGELPPQSDEDDSPESLEAIAAALSGLIEQHLSGTAQTAVSFDGRAFRYRFWTD